MTAWSSTYWRPGSDRLGDRRVRPAGRRSGARDGAGVPGGCPVAFGRCGTRRLGDGTEPVGDHPGGRAIELLDRASCVGAAGFRGHARLREAAADMTWVLLGLGCLVVVASAVGAAAAGNFYCSMPFLTPVTALGGPPIGPALAVA